MFPDAADTDHKQRHPRVTTQVLVTPVDVTDWQTAAATIVRWAQGRESRYVCLCNVHSLVTAAENPRFADALRRADLVAPDGAPVAWLMRRLGHRKQQRISGPDLMLQVCEHATAGDVSIYLLGSLPGTLAMLQSRLQGKYPGLRIAGAYSPPFRDPTAAEDRALVEAINAADAGVLFVGLGCPKQEQWMLDHRTRVNAVMIGVGAAFDFHRRDTQARPRVDARARLGMAPSPVPGAPSAVAALYAHEHRIRMARRSTTVARKGCKGARTIEGRAKSGTQF